MIESWCKGINDFIKQRVGVLEQCGYDPSHDQYETYCETVVLFFMVGTPRAGYDFGIGYINNAVEENVRLRLLMNMSAEI